MRNLLALAAMGLLVFVGLGWYLGWYKVQNTPSADGHRDIHIDLNTPKIKDDVNKGKSKLHDFLATDQDGPPLPPVTTPPIPGTATSYRVNSDGSLTYTGDSVPPPLIPPGNTPPRLPMPQ